MLGTGFVSDIERQKHKQCLGHRVLGSVKYSSRNPIEMASSLHEFCKACKQWSVVACYISCFHSHRLGIRFRPYTLEPNGRASE